MREVGGRGGLVEGKEACITAAGGDKDSLSGSDPNIHMLKLYTLAASCQ